MLMVEIAVRRTREAKFVFENENYFQNRKSI